jgi:hypothetical protein
MAFVSLNYCDIGKNHGAVKELEELYEYAKSYGYSDWLHFDASICIAHYQ